VAAGPPPNTRRAGEQDSDYAAEPGELITVATGDAADDLFTAEPTLPRLAVTATPLVTSFQLPAA